MKRATAAHLTTNTIHSLLKPSAQRGNLKPCRQRSAPLLQATQIFGGFPAHGVLRQASDVTAKSMLLEKLVQQLLQLTQTQNAASNMHNKAPEHVVKEGRKLKSFPIKTKTEQHCRNKNAAENKALRYVQPLPAFLPSTNGQSSCRLALRKRPRSQALSARLFAKISIQRCCNRLSTVQKFWPRSRISSGLAHVELKIVTSGK